MSGLLKRPLHIPWEAIDNSKCLYPCKSNLSPTAEHSMQQNFCRYSDDTVGATATGMIRIRRGKESSLLAAVAVVGPITVAVDSRRTSFQVNT